MTKLVNRAKMTTATTGTGTITLGSAVDGYQSFADAGVVDADVVRYVVEDGTDWEIGRGTYTATGTLLARTTILESSNADAALNLSGSAVVYVSATAEDITPPLDFFDENPGTFTAPSATGTNAVAIGPRAVASGENSTAFYNSNASGFASFAAGIYNNSTTLGAKGEKTVALGTNATAVGLSSVALGSGATSNASFSAALGPNSVTETGSNNIALGSAYSSGTFSLAAVIANNTSAYGSTGANSVAIGQLAKATAANSIAIGDTALSTTANLIALGGTTDTVQISGTYTLPTTDGTTGQVLTTNGAGVVTFADAGGGGTALELYAENPSSPTAPSATGTNAVAIGDQSVSIGTRSVALGDSYASGIDSFAAAIANNTSSYGATGANSVAIGYQAKANATGAMAFGDRNTASGEDAVVFGESNTGSGPWSFTAGRLNANSGSRGVALGNAHTVSGFYTTALGSSNTASQNFCTAIGSNSLADKQGKLAHASLGFGTDGDAQYGRMVLAKATTDATPVALTSVAGNAASDINQIILPNNSAYAFHGTIVARQQASQGTACAAWKIEGLIRREGSAGTTVLVNSATTVLDNTPAWGMALSADTTNGGLKIEVTGAAATNIRFVATIHTSECTY